MAVDVYQSRAPSPSIGGISIRPITPPDLSGGELIGEAVSRFGGALSAFAQRRQDAQETTRQNVATTDFITNLDSAENAAATDPDYQKAPQKFIGTLSTLEADALKNANLTPEKAAAFQVILRQHGLAAKGRVDVASLNREGDANMASMEKQELSYLNSITTAGSPVERQASLAQLDQMYADQVKAGWIHADVAEARKQKLLGAIDEADVIKGIRIGPESIKTALADPKNFRYLDPAQRERYIATAETEASNRRIDALRFKAAGATPEDASMAFGTVLSPTHSGAIFRRGIVKIEGGLGKGGVGLTSPKGALGVSQIIPPTARLMARMLGMNDVAALPEAQLRSLLLTNHDLNAKLGEAYWNSMVSRYGGNIGLAAAAYNAGPGRADQWRAAAVGKFGENFTPAQLASVIGIKETRDYVLHLYGALGASPTGPGLAAGDEWKGYSAVGEVLRSSDNARSGAIKDYASLLSQTGGDDMIARMREGYAVDQSALADYKLAQAQAAAAGSNEAAGRLYKLEQAQAAQPAVEKAYSMPPAALDSAISNLEGEAFARPLSSAEQTNLDAYKAVKTTIGETRDTDPVGLAVRARMFRETPVDAAASPDDPNFAASLSMRADQAAAARETYGGALLPFHPAEASALKDRFAGAGDGEKLALLTTMAKAMGPRGLAAAAAQIQLDPMTATASLFAGDRPELARKILRGAELMKTGGVEKPVAELRAALARKIGGDLYPPGSGLTERAIDAATAVYVADRSGAGTLFNLADQTAIETAIEQVTGKIVTRNGVKVAAPPGITASQFDTAADRLSDTAIAAAGGAFDASGQPVPIESVRGYGVFRQLALGGSDYVVGMADKSAPDGFAPFRAKSGRPLVVDMGVELGRPPPAPAIDPFRMSLPMMFAPPGLSVGVRASAMKPPAAPAAPLQIAPAVNPMAAAGGEFANQADYLAGMPADDQKRIAELAPQIGGVAAGDVAGALQAWHSGKTPPADAATRDRALAWFKQLGLEAQAPIIELARTRGVPMTKLLPMLMHLSDKAAAK